jgi:3-(3-hydroxy-phenyl)propionate hydroxylase
MRKPHENATRNSAPGNPKYSPSPRLAWGPDAPLANTLWWVTYGQPTLSNGQLLDVHLGQRFALLARAELLRALTPMQEQALREAHVLLLADTEPEIHQWLSREQLGAVLLRPDRYIAATAESAADVPAMLALLPA